MSKVINVTVETATNSNRENTLKSIKREAAEMSLELGRQVEIWCGSKCLAAFLDGRMVAESLHAFAE